jgi:hypothetical protein
MNRFRLDRVCTKHFVYKKLKLIAIYVYLDCTCITLIGQGPGDPRHRAFPSLAPAPAVTLTLVLVVNYFKILSTTLWERINTIIIICVCVQLAHKTLQSRQSPVDFQS